MVAGLTRNEAIGRAIWNEHRLDPLGDKGNEDRTTCTNKGCVAWLEDRGHNAVMGLALHTQCPVSTKSGVVRRPDGTVERAWGNLVECPQCQGHGHAPNTDTVACPSCDGEGVLSTEGPPPVTLPPGAYIDAGDSEGGAP